MERLTGKTVYLPCFACNSNLFYDCKNRERCESLIAFKRLYAYEDTELMPEEIKALKEENVTLKKALEKACYALDYTPSGNTLMNLYIQQVKEDEQL